jgi:hypothetical protein
MSVSHLFTVALVEPVIYLPLETGDTLVVAVLILLQDPAGLVEGPNHVYCQDQPKYLASSQLFIFLLE